ncbi:hypothetical protein [Novipirellula artificiosorum]|uniref:Uncharacterized protein n=1 Tax=Novipirellula artificiosorum TaxID=2528016 RepID=A0A5C6D5G1_9BACT|nr:hypothetical protein [Novipirellula artificiosorum]TWU32048.1 hypothetical protein Poly41_59360 [Novipirellula artificiosorum]
MQNPLKRLTRRRLVLLLLPLVALAILLIPTGPGMSWGSLFLIRQHGLAIYQLTAYDYELGRPTWHQEFRLNLNTGACEKTASENATKFYWGLDDRGSEIWIEQIDAAAEPDDDKVTRFRYTVIDPATNRLLLSSEFHLPKQNLFKSPGYPYFVGGDSKTIFVANLQDPDADLITFPHSFSVSFLPQIPNHNRFVAIDTQTRASSAKTFNPSVQTLHLFEFGESGQPRLLSSWPIGNGGFNLNASEGARIARSFSSDGSNWFDPNLVVGYGGEVIATLNPQLDAIEFRSVVDGTLLESLPAPAGIGSPNVIAFFNQSLFTVESNDHAESVDITRRKAVPSPEAKLFVVDQLDEEGYLLFLKPDFPKQYILFDRENERVVQRFDEAGSKICFLDRNRLAALSDKYGFSVTLLDANNGNVLAEHRPFWWVPAALCLFLVGYAVWSVAWVVVSARENGRAWFDSVLIGGVPLLLLTARALYGGPPTESDRLCYQYAQGIAVAAIVLASVWLLLGKTRLSLRVLPFITLLALLLAILGFVFREQSSIAWIGFMSTLVLSSVLFPVILLLWVFRASIERQVPALQWDASGDQAKLASKVALRDLFYATLVAAFLFAAIRPLMATIRVAADVDFLRSFLQPELLHLLLGLGATLAVALNRRRMIVWAGAIVVGSLFALLATDSTARFIMGRSYDATEPFSILTRIILTSVISLFVMLMPYRLRSWVWARRTKVRYS